MPHKRYQIIILLFICFSCNNSFEQSDNCAKKFYVARQLALTNPDRKSALDSALDMTTESSRCATGNLKKTIVDFKIRLLVNSKRYSDAINYIDSLNENDFTFDYKKKFIRIELRALDFSSKNDTVNAKQLYQEIDIELQKYLQTHNIKSNDLEFNEIYTDLFEIKEKYMSADQIKAQAQALEDLFPEKKSFFEIISR